MTRMVGAALTNYPALDMPALAASTATRTAAAALTAGELAVCRSLGISEEKFRESRAADLERAPSWG